MSYRTVEVATLCVYSTTALRHPLSLMLSLFYVIGTVGGKR